MTKNFGEREGTSEEEDDDFDGACCSALWC
jgi:hypothetical protein